MQSSGQKSIFDDFFNSYVDCFGLLTKTNYNNISENDGFKLSVDQNIQKFLNSARKMENFFLKKRLLLASQKPEDLIIEEIKFIELEIKNKDQAIKQFYDKLEIWKNMLENEPLSSLVE